MIMSVFVVALGVALITFSEQLAHRLPAFTAAFLIFHAVIITTRALLAGKGKMSTLAYVVAGVYVLLAAGVIAARIYLGYAETGKIIAVLIAVYSFADAGEALFDILHNRKVFRRVFVDVIMITIHVILGIGLLTNSGESVAVNLSMYGTVFVVRGMITAIRIMGEQMKINTFMKVLIKSHALEILSGLLFTIIAASVVFPLIEPEIKNFGDGMWYSFALVTTIGFGDLSAVTPLGRTISVFIGIYGIVVVALVTSIFVNIYNDVKQSKKEEEKSEEGAEKFISVSGQIAKVVTGKEIAPETPVSRKDKKNKEKD